MTDDAISELVGRCVERDGHAFRQLVVAHQSYAFALAIRLLCDDEDARDVVQEAFVRVWKHIDRFDRTKKLTTWLYSIVTNLAIDRLRTIRRDRRLFVRHEEDSPFDIQDERDLFELQSNQDLVDIIRTLTQRLPLKQRLVFTLRDLQDLSVEEVADIAGMSLGSVKANLCYARQTIRKHLAVHYRVGRLEL